MTFERLSSPELERTLFKKYLQGKFPKNTCYPIVATDSEVYARSALSSKTQISFESSRVGKYHNVSLSSESILEATAFASELDKPLPNPENCGVGVEKIRVGNVHKTFEHSDYSFYEASKTNRFCKYTLDIDRYQCSVNKKGQKSWRSLTSGEIAFETILCHPGSFTMGLNAFDEEHASDPKGVVRKLGLVVGHNEKPEHEVVITKPFELGSVEVSTALFDLVIQGSYSLPSTKSKDRYPKTLTWLACLNFCNALSDLYGFERSYEITRIKRHFFEDVLTYRLKANTNGFRLPTEAEWEYAAKAGKGNSTWISGVSDWGEDGTKSFKDYAWTSQSLKKTLYGGITGPFVGGEKKPNAWGFCDMSGNLSEWCQDSYFIDKINIKSNDSKAEGRYGSWLDTSGKRVDPLIQPAPDYLDAIVDTKNSQAACFCGEPMSLRYSRDTRLFTREYKIHKDTQKGILKFEKLKNFVILSSWMRLLEESPKGFEQLKVIRGGSCFQSPNTARITEADGALSMLSSTSNNSKIGFRIARTVQPQKERGI